jgi:signal transduction histidine kinase
MTQESPQELIDAIRAILAHITSSSLSSEQKSELEACLQQVERLNETVQKNDLALQEARQARSKFVSVVTHELRIPMTSIKGYTDLMRSGVVGPVNEQQSNFLNIIRNNVERMSALVSDLSDMNHLETGRLKLDYKPVSISDCVSEALAILKSRLDEKQQSLVCEIPGDLHQTYADANRVIQILIYLIGNASKYTPANGQINVRARLQGDIIRIEVKDTGIGINPADQAQLFKAFFRSEEAAVRDQPGWGLSLHVARGLVELMGGEIGVESVIKEGSTFWFTLPVSKGRP